MTPYYVPINVNKPLIEAYYALPCSHLGITKKQERTKLMPIGRFPIYKKQAVSFIQQTRSAISH